MFVGEGERESLLGTILHNMEGERERERERREREKEREKRRVYWARFSV